MRKRGRQEMEEESKPPQQRSLLMEIRNMWEFSNLTQWIFTFGGAIKLDENLDVEEIEMECLKPSSTVLSDIGLALLKNVSSHKGLTPAIFDEYTRRQYSAKAPERNPFGIEEEPNKFADFDIFTKIRILQQLTQWVFINPDRIREKMEEQKDTEQTIWRIEPFGWDADDRTYFVLDDNRLYRRTDPPPPPPPARKPKKGSKKAKASRRTSKRRKLSEPVDSEIDPTEDDNAEDEVDAAKEDDSFGGMKWECLAVTLDEFNHFIGTIDKSRDANEKVLKKRLVEDVLPLLEKDEEKRKRKQAQKERELLNLEKLATAKRSSRIAGKMEIQKHEEESREAERKRQNELIMAKKEQEKWLKLEKERESRMITREQRVKEREARRILHEEELANLSEDNKKVESGEGRLSERHLKAEIERKKQALKELTEEEDWVFDCICGAYGQIDDGTHSIACDRCNVWQHSKCVGVSQADAEREEFHFICKTCERRAQDAERAKTHPPIKIKINKPGSSSSALAKQTNSPNISLRVNGHDQLPPLHSFPPPHVPGHSSSQHALPASPQKPSTQNGNGHATALASSPLRAPSSAYSAPYVSYKSNGVPAAITPYGSSIPSGTHVFSSPIPHSPISLPPPSQHVQHISTNGSHPSSPYQQRITESAATIADETTTQASPTRATLQNFGSSTPQIVSGFSAPAAKDEQRQSSLNMPSSLAATPVLGPGISSSGTSGLSGNHANSNTESKFPKTPQQTAGSPPQPAFKTLNEVSGLPSTSNGISPTKHSPPRPTTSNGSFGSVTPSVLPPVASLSPSPRILDPTPPIKHSDVDRNRPPGQSISS